MSRTRTHNCSIDKEEVVCSIFCFCTGDETLHRRNCRLHVIDSPYELRSIPQQGNTTTLRPDYNIL
jgi:hypothetical protein